VTQPLPLYHPFANLRWLCQVRAGASSFSGPSGSNISKQSAIGGENTRHRKWRKQRRAQSRSLMCTHFAGKHQKTWHGMLLTTCKCEYRDQGYDVR